MPHGPLWLPLPAEIQLCSGECPFYTYWIQLGRPSPKSSYMGINHYCFTNVSSNKQSFNLQPRSSALRLMRLRSPCQGFVEFGAEPGKEIEVSIGALEFRWFWPHPMLGSLGNVGKHLLTMEKQRGLNGKKHVLIEQLKKMWEHARKFA